MRLRKQKITNKLAKAYDGTQYKPIFNHGMLFYENSGHTLTPLKDFYTCAEKQKSKCFNEHEKMLNRQNFERKFRRYTKDLKIDKKIGTRLFFDIQKEAADYTVKMVEEITDKRENMDITLKAMQKDLKLGNKIKPSDLAFLKEEYWDIMKINYPAILIYYMQGLILFLTEFEYNEEVRASDNLFECMVEKIYICDDGKIKKIKFEGLGDFIFQYIEKKIPGYMNEYKIPIIERRRFSSLDIGEAMEFFKQNNYRDTLSYTNFRSGYYEEKAKKELLKNIKSFNPNQIIEIGYHLKDYLWRDPVTYMTPVCFTTTKAIRDLDL